MREWGLYKENGLQKSITKDLFRPAIIIHGAL